MCLLYNFSKGLLAKRKKANENCRLFSFLDPRTPYRVRCPFSPCLTTLQWFQSAHPCWVRCWQYEFSLRFNPRTNEGGAMATHSKIRPFRALTLPHSSQNQRNLENPFPHTHPCARSLRKNAPILCLLEVYTRTFLAHLTIICVAVARFRSSCQTTFFWSTSSPNQATSSTLLDNQRPHQTFLFGLSTRLHLQKVVTHI